MPAPNRPTEQSRWFIRHADDVIRLGTPVVLYARVSGREQERQGSLDRQIAQLKAYAARRGAVVINIDDIRPDVDSGKSLDRPELLRDAALAHEHNALILAHNVGRLIRSAEFHRTRNPGAQPTQAEYAALANAVGGVTLATILHPDTPWRQVRSAETRRGKRAAKPRMPRAERHRIISIMGRDVIRYHWSLTARELMRASARYRESAATAAAALIRLGCTPRTERSPTGRPTTYYHAPMSAFHWWWRR